jgi:hypothetical protein
MLIDNAPVTSMIQPASSHGRKLENHRRWAPRLWLKGRRQLRFAEAAKFLEF